MPTRFVHAHLEKHSKSFAPSFYASGFISDRHQRAETLVGDVRGKLAPGDHYKLYEAGYFARGPVLEIGRLHARSTILISMGIHDAGHGNRLTSIEFEDKYLPAAERNLARFGLRGHVSLLQGDSSTLVRGLDEIFDTVFVDGSHKYEGVARDIDALDGKVAPGGIVMFHDYYHVANDDGRMGVRRAVDERCEDLGLAFRGRFGGIAVFERVG